MNEIKYRIYDVIGCEMVNVDSLFIGEKMFKSDDMNDYDVFKFDSVFYSMPMQYTGLKDKNCVEIYEGDIIEIKNLWTNGVGKWSHFVGEIIFFDCEFQAKDINDNYISLYMYKSRNEVIGNKYENQELLKGEK